MGIQYTYLNLASREQKAQSTDPQAIGLYVAELLLLAAIARNYEYHVKGYVGNHPIKASEDEKAGIKAVALDFKFDKFTTATKFYEEVNFTEIFTVERNGKTVTVYPVEE